MMTETNVLSAEEALKRTEKLWIEKVLETHQNRCANCGSSDRLHVRMVVPRKAGGKYIPSNGIPLCRACEFATDASKASGSAENQRLVNFWMSRGLHDRVQALISRTNGFTSVGALVRYMMSQYVLDPGRYDDLTLYQDRDNDVRSSVWADRGTYATFQTLLSKAGLTVTDAVKSLLMAYEATVSASTESQE